MLIVDCIKAHLTTFSRISDGEFFSLAHFSATPKNCPKTTHYKRTTFQTLSRHSPSFQNASFRMSFNNFTRPLSWKRAPTTPHRKAISILNEPFAVWDRLFRICVRHVSILLHKPHTTTTAATRRTGARFTNNLVPQWKLHLHQPCRVLIRAQLERRSLLVC